MLNNLIAYQYNITFCDTVQSDLCVNRTGFSGTPYFDVPYDRIKKKTLKSKPETSKEAEGNIYYSCIQENTKIFEITDTELLDEKKIIYNKIYNNNSEGGDKIVAVIDVAGIFVGQENIQVAEELYDKLVTIQKDITVCYLKNVVKWHITVNSITQQQTFLFFICLFNKI